MCCLTAGLAHQEQPLTVLGHAAGAPGTHTAQQRRVALLAGAAEGAPRWRTSLAGLASGFPGGSQEQRRGRCVLV